MPVAIKFPANELLDFLGRAKDKVYNARRNGRRLARDGKYQMIVDELRNFFPRAEIHLYGSRAMGLGNHKSDLDIYIDVNGSFFTGESRQVAERLVREISKKLRQCANWEVRIALETATVPVVFSYYKPLLNLKCDIVFSDGLGVKNCELMMHLFNLQPQHQAIKLYHAVRIWLAISGIKLRKLQIQILVIFFLQKQSLLPSIEKVQKGVKRQVINSNNNSWNVQFNPNRTLQSYKLQTMDNFKRYLPDFFLFYAGFNYQTHVIFPHFGEPVLKENYANQDGLQHLGDLSGFKNDKPMAMASLLSVDYNVTWDIGRDRLKQFVNCCAMSEQLLNNT